MKHSNGGLFKMVKPSKKGWSATLKEELGVSASPLQKQPGRRETRAAAERKANRRQKARRWTAYSGKEALQQKINSRLERLECTNFGDALDQDLGNDDAGEDSEDYNEQMDSSSEEDDSDFGGTTKGSRSKKSGASKKGKGKGKSQSKRKRGQTRPRSSKGRRKKIAKPVKKRRVKSLAEILLDENATKLSKVDPLGELAEPDYISATVKPSRYPPRKFCVVTGQFGKYKDPESSLYYASLKTYRTLKEQPPPWVRSSGIAPYFEAIESIRDDRKRIKEKLR